jgi:nucleotide-binding universal stress UspA family protein
METQRIIVGLDQSPAGEAALRWASAYAARIGGRLRLLHVIEIEPSDIYGSTAELVEDLHARAYPELQAFATEVIGATLPSESWTLDIVQGSRGRRLVEAADTADLLVIGTREHVGLQRLLAGSVSHYCLAHSQTPVLAVPPPVAVGVRPESRASAFHRH